MLVLVLAGGKVPEVLGLGLGLGVPDVLGLVLVEPKLLGVLKLLKVLEVL